MRLPDRHGGEYLVLRLRKLLTSEMSDDCPAKVRQTVAIECVDFLRAGGTISLADWDDFSAFGRSCLADASRMLQGERAAAGASSLVVMVADALRVSREASALKNAADAAAAAVPQENA